MLKVQLTDKEVIVTIEKYEHNMCMDRVIVIPYENAEQIYFILEDIIYQKGKYGSCAEEGC